MNDAPRDHPAPSTPELTPHAPDHPGLYGLSALWQPLKSVLWFCLGLVLGLLYIPLVLAIDSRGSATGAVFGFTVLGLLLAGGLIAIKRVRLLALGLFLGLLIALPVSCNLYVNNICRLGCFG